MAFLTLSSPLAGAFAVMCLFFFGVVLEEIAKENIPRDVFFCSVVSNKNVFFCSVVSNKMIKTLFR